MLGVLGWLLLPTRGKRGTTSGAGERHPGGSSGSRRSGHGPSAVGGTRRYYGRATRIDRGEYLLLWW